MVESASAANAKPGAVAATKASARTRPTRGLMRRSCMTNPRRVGRRRDDVGRASVERGSVAEGVRLRAVGRSSRRHIDRRANKGRGRRHDCPADPGRQERRRIDRAAIELERRSRCGVRQGAFDGHPDGAGRLLAAAGVGRVGHAAEHAGDRQEQREHEEGATEESHGNSLAQPAPGRVAPGPGRGTYFLVLRSSFFFAITAL